MSVGLALAVARAVAAALGQADAVEVSLFWVALMAAMTFGAGTDYGISSWAATTRVAAGALRRARRSSGLTAPSRPWWSVRH